jgi:hypothetical protein
MIKHQLAIGKIVNCITSFRWALLVEIYSEGLCRESLRLSPTGNALMPHPLQNSNVTQAPSGPH